MVVAAADASDLSKSKADYICPGVNDQDTIQTAIDSLASGGRVLLTEGNFSIQVPSSAGAIVLGSFTNLIGMGGTSTYLIDDSSSDTGGWLVGLDGDNCVLRDFAIFGAYHDAIYDENRSTQTTNITIQDVYAESDAAVISASTGRYWLISGCWLQSNDFTDPCIYMGSIEDLTIADNLIISGGINNILIDRPVGQTPHDIHIHDNFLWSSGEEAIVIDMEGAAASPSYTFIHDNLIQAAGINLGAQIDRGAIHIIGNENASSDINDPGQGHEPSVFIHHNQIEDAKVMNAIHVVHLNLCQITNNYGDSVEGHGIVIEDTSGALVAGNVLVWPDTDDSYDAIRITGASDENHITQNRPVNDLSAGGPFAWRYGINIVDATCDCNIVVGNVLGATGDYGTDALNDNGSSTILFYPNDATYGDNFIGCWGS